jgi:outer membrane lipoprotein carrier protein
LDRFTWLVLALASVFSLPAQATGGRTQLDAFFDGLVTLRAEFRQRVIGPDAGPARVAEGVFYLQRPGLFRWEYRQPPQLIVADGDRVWLYDQELEQVSHQRQDRALRGTPAQLLVDTAPLEDYFVLAEIERGGDLTWVELRPRDGDSEFERILLGFGDGLLEQLEMQDSFGQVTLFRFSGLERNLEVDPELFRFVPPPGMDVFGTD